MGITKEQFVELVDKDSIGFILHMFCDTEEWALGTTSPKKKPEEALYRAIRAMMATMTGRKIINEKKWRKMDNEIWEIICQKDY